MRGSANGRIYVDLLPRLNKASPFRDTVRIDAGAGTTARRRTDPGDSSTGYFYILNTKLPIAAGDDHPTYTGSGDNKREWRTTLLIYTNGRVDAHNIVVTATSDRFGLTATDTLNIGKLRQHLQRGREGTPCHTCSTAGEIGVILVGGGDQPDTQEPPPQQEDTSPVDTDRTPTPDPQGFGQPITSLQLVPPALHADLIGRMNDWRNDPQWVSHKSHTDRWDRALLAFGEPVADTSLTPMTDAKAQSLADTPWGERWVPVAAALKTVGTGTSGTDTLTGTGNGELLVGLGGADTLSGQGGNDELRGGDGDDDLSGGGGADRFVFFSGETGANAITDFESGDVIVLKGSGWSSVSDIIAYVQAVGSGDYRYTLASGLTVETTNNRSLRTEDFVTD